MSCSHLFQYFYFFDTDMLPRNNFTFLFVWLLLLLPLWAAAPAAATEMVYSPVNPSFGGNPNNAPGLMSIAQAQNGFTAPVLSPIANFNLSLQRVILSRLTSQSLTTMFGANNTLVPSPIPIETVGYTILVSAGEIPGTITITTTDKTSGAIASFTINSATP